jgi:hypothetical protein
VAAYFPAVQSMHSDARVVVAPYFPASHGVQEVLLECEVVPASQDAQVADDAAPNTKEKEPAGHSWHSADAGVE